MLKHLVNLVRGEVTGRVESGFPERVLNLCAEYGIVFWDLNWASPVEFTFTMTRQDWKRLRRLSHRIDCDMTAVEWKGTPFFLGRIRRRYGLWVTLGICTVLIFWGSFFIWDFEIEGNEAVSQQEILRALDRHGVRFGTYGLHVDSRELRNYILLEIPELSYIAVNVRGCRAYVQVRERIPAPEIVSKREPGNTVAAGDHGEGRAAADLRRGAGRRVRGPLPAGNGEGLRADLVSSAMPGAPDGAGKGLYRRGDDAAGPAGWKKTLESLF